MAKAHMAGRTAACVPVPEKPSHVNRAVTRNLSGTAVANLMHGNGSAKPEEQSAPHSIRSRPQRNNFSSPRDFFAGPSKPGAVTHGIRRYGAHDQDMVGKMLTDDYLMSKMEVNKRVHEPHAQIDNACNVLTAEQPYRRGTKMLNSAQQLDAPYFEDNDPKPPRDTSAPVGRKHFKAHERHNIFAGEAAPTTDTAATEAPAPAHAATKYKSNRSYDILHLDRYKAEDLNEVRASNRQHKICKAAAPEMPLAKKPAVRRVFAHAKEEHDVLGTGRFGKPEATPCTGVAHVASRGKNGALNIFAPPPSQRQQQEQHHSRLAKATNTNSLLRYYDPAIDAPAAPAKVRAQAYRANCQSHEVAPPPHKKASGEFNEKNSKRSCELFWPE